jgi:thermitase
MTKTLFFVISVITLLIGTKSHSDIHKIAIIDTGLDVQDARFKHLICGHRDFTGEGIKDISGHGTHVAGLIKRHAAGSLNYCFLILKYYSANTDSFENINNFISALKEAVRQKASIVNFSGGGTQYVQEEYDIIKNTPWIKYVVAAGNEGLNIDIPKNRFYPASYDLPNIISVGNLEDRNTISNTSNYGFTVKVWEIGTNVISTVPCRETCESAMSGTSMATGIVTGKMIGGLNK